MELQEALPELKAAGLRVYAISYDEPEALAAFAAAHDIGYPLLSDADSSVIRRLGILNTLIEPSDVPFYGIPYPGTFLLDRDGVIVEKFFPRHLAMRESAETLVDTARGRAQCGDVDPKARGGDDSVRITAFLRGGRGTFKVGPKRRLIVRLELRDGLHVYGEPLPEGMGLVESSVRVEAPAGLNVEDPIAPPTEPLRLAALGVELQVWTGVVDFALPIWASSRLMASLAPSGSHVVPLDITVRYQACDDRTCLLPRTERLRLEVPVAPPTLPNLPPLAGRGVKTTPMDTRHHMRELVDRQRRLSADPG